MKLLLLLLVSFVASGQVIFQATASQGNGDQCTGTKNANTNTNFVLNCSSIVAGHPSESHKIYNAGGVQPKVGDSQTIHFGDVLCMFGVNPTNHTLNFGSLGDVPATSLIYSCALAVRANGVFTGNVIGPFGIVHWP